MKNYLLLTALLVCCFLTVKSQNNDPIILPFPPLDAKISNNKLHVEWTTPVEENVKHYNIEISGEGTTFTKIGTVLSKTEDGNSSSPLTYTFTKSVTGLLTGSLLLLSILGFSVNKSQRRSTKYVLATLAIGLTALISCQKSEIDKVEEPEILYLRIAQVDKLDHTLYSKVVRVQ